MRIRYTRDGGRSSHLLEPDRLATVLKEEESLIWLSLTAEDTTDKVEQVLEESFGFHPLAIDDTVNEVHLPKIDDWERYLYVVLRDLRWSRDPYEIELPEIDIFLGGNYLVTYQSRPVETVEKLWHACEKDERLLRNGPAYLLYRLVDELVNCYLAVIEEMEDDLEAAEQEVLSRPRPLLQSHIMEMKHSVLQLRRVIALQREVLNRLARDEFDVVDATNRLYFRDVYDHMIRLYDLVDGLRDLATSALDIYLSAANNRLNDVMKTLTLITTLFMPLTFLTGFFGMNFLQPSESGLSVWTGREAFVIVLALMGLVPFFMYIWMHRRAWM